MKELSEKLKCLRRDAELTQKQLAERLGLTQRKISYLESGKIEPDMYTLVLISKYFEVSADYLLGLED